MSQFILTKEHVVQAFSPLAEIDPAARAPFFTNSMVPDIIWTITGSAHSLAGTRTNLQSHSDATFKRLDEKLRGPVKFMVGRVIVDAQASEDGWWACVEAKGEAMTNSGENYNNEYVWLTRWNDEGKIVEVRAYFDTMLSEQLLL